jgi:HK97 family phage prohead protease
MSDDFRYKSVGFSLKSSKVIKGDGGSEYFVFSGYGSTWQVDSDQDQILPGAFDSSVRKGLPALLWSHDRWEPAIGLITDAKEDDVGLFIRAKMPLEDTRVATMFKPQIELGSIDRMSIGFRILSDERVREPEPGGADRLIKDLDLMEISLVNKNFAANDGARITALEKELKRLKGQENIDKDNNNELKQLLELSMVVKKLNDGLSKTKRSHNA